MKSRPSTWLWAGLAVVQMWIIVLLSQWIYTHDHSLTPETLNDKSVLFIAQAVVGFLCDLYIPHLVTLAYILWLLRCFKKSRA